MHTARRSSPNWREQLLPLEAIRTNQTLQLRSEGLKRRLVREYADKMLRGEEFPPVEVAKIGRSYMLLDGFHRVAAAQLAGITTSLLARVATMTEVEAELYAFGVNTSHGERLRNADKRHRFAEYVGRGHHLREDGTVKSAYAMAEDLRHVPVARTIYNYLAKAGIEPGAAEDDGLEPKAAWRGDARPRLLQSELPDEVRAHIDAIAVLTDELEAGHELRGIRASLIALARQVGQKVAESCSSGEHRGSDLQI
ncbi:MAG TPA: ParB N-terminal domain-containing protein [Allosphingosinicella sp.]|nr:ParB N-terminal domain-containing protein [Allosphingosinicella sp.]